MAHDQPGLRNLGHRATVGNHREDALYLCSVTLISLMGGECHASSEGAWGRVSRTCTKTTGARARSRT